MFSPATRVPLIAVLSLSGIAIACDDSPSGPSETVTIVSQATLDGFARSDGTATSAGGAPVTGDLDGVTPGLASRQFYSFDLSSIPGTATIDSAVLRVYQAAVVGAPYTTHGSVIVDRVDIGTALDGADYGAAALTGNIGTISNNATLEYKTLDVTTAVRADRNAGRTRSEFRLRFSVFDTNGNATSNNVSFADAEDSCCGVASPPQLVVEYVEDDD